MEVYVARQPIFDRHMNLYGYELLYRQGGGEAFDGSDDTRATAELISNSFLVIGFPDLVDGTRGFINFPQTLLEQEVPRLLPREQVVVEILERVTVTDELVRACRRLKADGYTLALDDFIPAAGGDEGGWGPLIDLADIVKVDFRRSSAADQRRFLQRRRGGGAKFLAEKIETAQEYRRAADMGYDLFQGFFFSKPVLLSGTEIGSLDASLMRLLDEAQKSEPDFTAIAAVVQSDLGLTYKLLKMVNSVFYGAKYPIRSIRHALARLGTQEILQWVYLMLINGVRNPENAELIKASMVRAKVLSLLALELGDRGRETDYFLTGLFSLLDCILNDSMENILDGLLLAPEVKDALLGIGNDLRASLNVMLAFERAQWGPLNRFLTEKGLTQERYLALYRDALRWQRAFTRAV